MANKILIREKIKYDDDKLRKMYVPNKQLPIKNENTKEIYEK